ncbi:MAG: low-complexity tail membrane protein [Cyanobacteria bacterium J06639_14]
MTSLRRDPYLWIHLAGFATLPLWLDICLASLAVGDPIVPPWLELGLLGITGSAPILWMQWRRPFYIFSLLAIAIRPDRLEDNRRRLLSLQQTWVTRLLVFIAAMGLLTVLALLYQLAPIAATTSPFVGQSRTTGWLICAASFLLANLFVQVPASILPMLMVSPQKLMTVQPYEPSQVLQDFTIFGIRVSRILPAFTASSSPTEFLTSVNSNDAGENTSEDMSEHLINTDNIEAVVPTESTSSRSSVV